MIFGVLRRMLCRTHYNHSLLSLFISPTHSLDPYHITSPFLSFSLFLSLFPSVSFFLFLSLFQMCRNKRHKSEPPPPPPTTKRCSIFHLPLPPAHVGLIFKSSFLTHNYPTGIRISWHFCPFSYQLEYVSWHH